MRVVLMTVGLSIVLASVAFGAEDDPGLLERQRFACLSDAIRLCGDEMPDLEAVKACMRGKKSLVSPACAAFYPRNAK